MRSVSCSSLMRVLCRPLYVWSRPLQSHVTSELHFKQIGEKWQTNKQAKRLEAL